MLLAACDKKPASFWRTRTVRDFARLMTIKGSAGFGDARSRQIAYSNPVPALRRRRMRQRPMPGDDRMTYLVAFRTIVFVVFLALSIRAYRDKARSGERVHTHEELIVWLGIILTGSGFLASFAPGEFRSN
jgi:hypothetical protein